MVPTKDNDKGNDIQDHGQNQFGLLWIGISELGDEKQEIIPIPIIDFV